MRWSFSCVLLAVLACGLAGLPAPVRADEMTGRVCVVDGDTLMFGGKRRHTKCQGGQVFDLWGIAAFKLRQQCRHPNGRAILCGRYAAAMLTEKIKKSEVRCEVKDPRPDGSKTAECFAGDVNLNRHMVENGLALAYPPDTERFTAHEAMAKEAKKGMWITRFTPPWQIE